MDFENQIFAFFEVYFWPFGKSHEKINTIFVISAIMASIWNVIIKLLWHDEKLTKAEDTPPTPIEDKKQCAWETTRDGHYLQGDSFNV